MKIFLEDDNAVHKLVASQYKIAPEKLMRTGGYTAPPRKYTEEEVLGREVLRERCHVPSPITCLSPKLTLVKAFVRGLRISRVVS